MVVDVDDRGGWHVARADRRTVCGGFGGIRVEGVAAVQRGVFKHCSHVHGTDAFGAYTGTLSEYECEPGLAVTHEVRRYPSHAFVTVRVQVTNISSEDIALREVSTAQIVVDVPFRGSRLLTNAWERCQGENLLVHLDAQDAAFSAWNVLVGHPDDVTAVAVGALSANTMFTSIKVEPDAEGNACVTPRGDTRSGERGVLLPPGEVLAGDPIVVVVSNDAETALETYAKAVGTYHGIEPRKSVTCGWLDWYCYYGDVSEKTTLANMNAIDRELKGYGVEYIQVDDGWQQVKHHTYYEEVDLRCTACSGAPWEPNEHFPQGMKALADEIHRRGYRAGLWIRPFCVMKEAEEFRRGEPWVLPYGPDAPMPERASIDVSHPDALRWVGDLFRRVASEWGYDYIKYDFVTYDLLQNQHFDLTPDDAGTYRIRDPYMTSARAIYNAFHTIRQAAGPDTYLLGCNSLAGAFGLIDGYRLAGDVLITRWDVTHKMLRAGPQRYYFNRVVWQNDLDVLMVGDRLSLAQARLWASYVGLAAGLVMLGDSMPDLPQERFDILRKVLPVYPERAKPVGLLDSSFPRIWHLPIEKPYGRWDVVALCNWHEESSHLGIDFERLGLDTAKEYAVFDFWNGAYVGDFHDGYWTMLDGFGCRVLSIRERTTVPQVISTHYHITQGGRELEDERWDAEHQTLVVRTEGVPGSQFRLFVGTVNGYSLDTMRLRGNEGRWSAIGRDIVEIEFTVSATGRDELKLAFIEEDERHAVSAGKTDPAGVGAPSR